MEISAYNTKRSPHRVLSQVQCVPVYVVSALSVVFFRAQSAPSYRTQTLKRPRAFLSRICICVYSYIYFASECTLRSNSYCLVLVLLLPEHEHIMFTIHLANGCARVDCDLFCCCCIIIQFYDLNTVLLFMVSRQDHQRRAAR